jgi:uncharacterized protein
MNMTLPDNTTIVRRYYELVDSNRLDDMLGLFNEEIEYERQGTDLIRGKAALRRFYEDQRIIASGKHSIEQVLADGGWVATRGVFEGTLTDGEDVTVRFTDWMHFSDGLIDFRQTLFPLRAI